MCASGQIAPGALNALREVGRSAPEEIAVIGYDGWAFISGQSRPQLLSIDMRFGQLGSTASRSCSNDAPARTAKFGKSCRQSSRREAFTIS